MRGRSCVVGHAWSVMRGRARSVVVVRAMRGRPCVVVRGSGRACAVVRGWSFVVVRGRARFAEGANEQHIITP